MPPRSGLIVAALGGIVELVGLGWDALLHAQDPGLAAREDLFTFGSAAHLALLGGIGLTVVGLAWELWFGHVAGPSEKQARTALAVLIVTLLVGNGAIAAIVPNATQPTDHHGTRIALRDDPLTVSLYGQVRDKGLGAALDSLAKLAEGSTEINGRGHDIAHALGEYAMSLSPNPKAAIRQCQPTFLYGCYHGVVRAYFASKGKTRPQDVVGICTEELGPLIRFQCLHGLGHGVLANLGHDLFRALTYCDALGKAFDRESCYGGVFMENIVVALELESGRTNSVGDSDQPPYLRPDDAHYPCDAVADRYRGSCYLLQTSGMLLYNGRSYAATGAACEKAPDRYVSVCFESLGRDISGDYQRDDAKTIAACSSVGTGPLRDHCFVGAVKNYLDALPRAFPFCRAVPESAKGKCYAAIGQQLSIAEPDPARRAAACSEAESRYVESCMSSNLPQ